MLEYNMKLGFLRMSQHKHENGNELICERKWCAK